MNPRCKLFVVDDDQTTALIIESMLEDQYAVEYFESAADCLARLSEELPDLFLLDVQMPGMDGYELCRRLKSMEATREIPAIFLSSQDTPEDILAGYDAGAQDYIVKPFEHTGLQRKVENILRIKRDRHELLNQAKASDDLAGIFMANLNEYAILIGYLRSLNECGDFASIVTATLSVLDAYKLEGAIQIRMRGSEKTFSRAGEDWPMEIAVINHVRNQGRIFEFKTRSVYNFDHITILITNMPLDDPDQCGRIRDNLAIVAESADAKLVAVQSGEDKARLRTEIAELLHGLSQTVGRYGRRYDEARFKSSLHTTHLLDELLAAMAHLGMAGEQEESILDLVRTQSYKLVDLYDFAGETSADLTVLGARLVAVLDVTTDQAGLQPALSPTAS